VLTPRATGHGDDLGHDRGHHPAAGPGPSGPSSPSRACRADLAVFDVVVGTMRGTRHLEPDNGWVPMVAITTVLDIRAMIICDQGLLSMCSYVRTDAATS
jgi:hypothetical protein